jgi:hypothetical protein
MYVSDERRRRILNDLFEENEATAELLERVLSSHSAFQQAFTTTNDSGPRFQRYVPLISLRARGSCLMNVTKSYCAILPCG